MATGILGGGLVRAQGLRAWVEIQKSLGKGQIPAVEIVSGLILVVIGTLLLTPGFITDTIAFLLLIPPLRKGASLAVIAYFKKNVKVQTLAHNLGAILHIRDRNDRNTPKILFWKLRRKRLLRKADERGSISGWLADERLLEIPSADN